MKKILLFLAGNLLFQTLVVFAIIEGISFGIICYLGINPFRSDTQLYGRSLSGYTIFQNSKNFSFRAVDGNNNFARTKLKVDENGFATGENQLQVEKEPGAVRIFLQGGSAAFGFLENHALTQDATYPGGMYSYNSSIAGELGEILKKKYPGKQFEVVNAAVANFQYHQSYLQYLSIVHYYKPDIIINFDGNNDFGYIGTIVDPSYWYQLGADRHLEDYIRLEVRKRQMRWPFTVYLVNYFIDKMISEKAPFEEAKADMPKKQKPGKEKMYNEKAATLNKNDISLNSYRIIEPAMVEQSQTLLWTLNTYENQLKADSVYSIFCVQPMLFRHDLQKELSPLEQKLRKNIEYNSAAPIGIKGYFFTQYFSPKADSIVKHYNGTFIDMNAEITHLTPQNEFYVDYCHLTPFGNRFVAERLAREVEKYVDSH